MVDRTTEIISLVVAALEAESYAIPAADVGLQLVTRPEGLVVYEQAVQTVEEEDGPAQGVFPVHEDPQFGAMGGGVMDNDLTFAVESVVALNGLSPHRALSPLRSWAYVALVHNAGLLAAMRGPVLVGRTKWMDPPEDAAHQLSKGRCVQVFTVKHRTLYASPNVPR